jgi:Flp pilus assembly pilin Flp
VRRTHRLASGQSDSADAADEAAATDPPDQAGQTTAEYALLTGAIALLVAAVTAWATSTGKIGRLLDAVFNYLTKAIS